MYKRYLKGHKLQINSKSQAAIEFLSTYAWAFIVILTAVGALYYFGIFDFSKFLPQRCTFPTQFECVDFAFVTDEIRFKLVNRIGEEIIVDDFVITNDAADPLTCTGFDPPLKPPPPAPPLTWVPGDEIDFKFTGCSSPSFIEGERTEAKITMTYYSEETASMPKHIINGKITSVVNP